MKLPLWIALLVSLLAPLCSGCATTGSIAGGGRGAPIDSVAFVLSSAAYVSRGLLEWDSDDAAAAVLDSLVSVAALDYGQQYALSFSNASGVLEGDPAVSRRVLAGVMQTLDEFRGPYFLQPPRAPRPILGVEAEDFDRFQALTGSRYNLVVLGLGSKMTTANRVLTVLALSLDPAETVTVEAGIIDAETGEVSRRVAVQTRLDPEVPAHVRAVVESAVQQVLTGKRVDPSRILRDAGE
jgi:hypothetical protein